MLMAWLFPHRFARRGVELLIAGELDVPGHRQLADHLRSCAACRLIFEREIALVRALENRPLARCEQKHLEVLLFAQAQLKSHRPTLMPWLAVAALGTAAAFLLIVKPSGDEFAVRGGQSASALALEAFCGTPPRPVRQSGCSLDESLTLSYRVLEAAVDQPNPAKLTIFGVESSGRPLYYTPTPDDREAIAASHGVWQALPFSTNLAMNHRPGAVRIFGLLAPRTLMIDEIADLAQKLAKTALPANGDEPWHRRAHADLARDVCEKPHECQSAELSFELQESSR